MFRSKIVLLILLFPLFVNAQSNHKDSLEINDQTDPEEYLHRANASLAAGLIFQGVGVVFIYQSPSEPIFIAGGALAIVIGTVAVIHSNYLRNKAKLIAMRRAKKKHELNLGY